MLKVQPYPVEVRKFPKESVVFNVATTLPSEGEEKSD